MELLLAFGIVATAILSLIGVFLSGVQLSASSRELAAGTQVAREVLEQIRANLRTGGPAYLPVGSYRFDGRRPDAPVGAAPLVFPPAPYPNRTVNGQTFTVQVEGTQSSATLLNVRVDVFWGPTGHCFLETSYHL